MSVLFCDSNCELWFDEVERLGLKFISMPYTLEDTEYFYDLGKNTDFDFWYKSVRNGAKCITSALNPEMYDEIFRPYFEKGEDIFYITFSHALSGRRFSRRCPRARLHCRYCRSGRRRYA